MTQKYRNRARPIFSIPLPKSVTKPRMKWRILPIVWLAFKRMCFVLGLVMFISAVSGVYLATKISNQVNMPAPIPSKMVLYLDLKQTLREQPREVSFADPFAQPAPTLRSTIDAIDMAAKDTRVQGLYVRMSGAASHSLAHLQELRAAIERFNETGKFTRIYAHSYGGASGGLGRFYLASAFEERWMQPLGIVSINGIRAEVPFARAVLDKIGITPNFYQRKEHKTAYETFMREDMSIENRESLTKMIAAMREVILVDVPQALDMQVAEFETLMDQGLFTADEALEEGLITHANYADELLAQMKERVTGSVDVKDKDLFVGLARYSASHKRSLPKDAPRVALVYIDGMILDGSQGQNAAADKIVPAIIEAAQDDKIEAIVLRVNSPGGSPEASERILHAVDIAKGKGKKIIVSMGSVAASGGYWVSAYADQIFVTPATVTGSIGVVGGKFSVGAMWEKLGLNWDNSVQWGENAGMWSLNTAFSETEAERVNAMLDNVYNAFVDRVARGRNMTEEAVDAIAGGRIWDGKAAIEVGLADQLGGLREALDYTATELGALDSSDLRVIQMPRIKTPLEQLLERIEGDSNGGGMIGSFSGIVSAIESLSDTLAFIQATQSQPVLAYDAIPLVK